MPDSQLASLLAAESILKDLEARGALTEDELAELWAALAQRWTRLKPTLDQDTTEQQNLGRSLLIELAGSTRNPDRLTQKLAQSPLDASPPFSHATQQKGTVRSSLADHAEGAYPDASAPPADMQSVGPYARLLGHRHAALAATVVLLAAVLGVGVGIVSLWRILSADGRFVMLTLPALIGFAAARQSRRRGNDALGNRLDLSAVLLGCTAFSATYFLSIRPEVLIAALVVFAVLVAFACRAILMVPWFAAAWTTWWFAVAQVWLSQLAPSRSHWVITAGAGLLALVAWRPWLEIPLRQDRVREVGWSLLTAGGAMLLLGLQALYHGPGGLYEYNVAMLGPAALLTSAAFLALAWSDQADTFRLSHETLRLVARLIALLLGATGLLLSLADARALTVSAGMLSLIGPIIWKAKVPRRWPILLSAFAFVALICAVWFRLSTGQSAGFAQWAAIQPGVGLPLGIGGLSLMAFAQFFVRRRTQEDLLSLPSFLTGVAFVVLAVIYCSRADWNIYSAFGFAACVLLFGSAVGKVEVVYVGLLLGVYGAWQEGLDAQRLLGVGSPLTAGSFGIGAYVVALALLAMLSRAPGARRADSLWATPAVRLAWVGACLSVVLGMSSAQPHEISSLIGAMAAAVLLIAAAWEERPPLAAAGAIILIAMSAASWLRTGVGEVDSTSLAFNPAAAAIALGCMAHVVTWKTHPADRWYLWARAVYLGTLSFLVPLAVDAFWAARGLQSGRLLWDLVAGAGVSVLGVGFLPSGLPWAMFAACISCAAAIALTTGVPGKPASTLIVHATAGLAVLWIIVGAFMRQIRRRADQTTHHGESALAVFDFAAIFAGMICALILIWRVANELMSRLINLHTQHVPVHWSGLVDLAVLLGVCGLCLWLTRHRTLITPLYWVLLLAGTWASLMIPQYKEVRHPVTDVAQAVPTAWPATLMMVLAVITAVFVFIQGYQGYRIRVTAWPDRLENLRLAPPGWPGFRISVGAVSLVIFMLGTWQVSSVWTVIAAVTTGTCLFTLAHRYWNSDLAEVAMGHITLAVCSSFLLFGSLFGIYDEEFAVRFPVACNVVLVALAVMMFIWHWLPRVWAQQLDNGQAWTTAGRLIPVSMNFAFLVGALGVLVSMSMALWPLTPNTPVPDNTTGRWVFGLAGNLALLAVLTGAVIRTKRDTLAWLTAYAILAALAFVAVRVPMNVYKEWLIHHWPFVLALLVVASGAIGPVLAKTRLKPFVPPITLLANGPLPLLALAGMFAAPRVFDDRIVAVGTPALLAVACAVSAFRSRNAAPVFLCAALVNLALIELWRTAARPFDTAYGLYLVPPGLTVLALAYLYRKHQTMRLFHLTRSVGLGLVFTPLAAHQFQDRDTPYFLYNALALTAGCVLALLAGFYWRAKPMLFFGAAFLLIELTALARYSYDLQSKGFWLASWVLLPVIVVSVAVWQIRRDRLGGWWSALSRWDG